MNFNADKVYQALSQVIDPELGIDIVRLGLIYEVEVGERTVRIEMTMTTPGCPLAPYFQEQVPAVVAQHCGIDEKDIKHNFTFDPPWTMDMMDEEARAELGFD